MLGLRVSEPRCPRSCLFQCQSNSVTRYPFDNLSSLDHNCVAAVSENTIWPRYIMRKLRAHGSRHVSPGRCSCRSRSFALRVCLGRSLFYTAPVRALEIMRIFEGNVQSSDVVAFLGARRARPRLLSMVTSELWRWPAEDEIEWGGAGATVHRHVVRVSQRQCIQKPKYVFAFNVATQHCCRVRLNPSTCPFVCGWYVMVKMLWTWIMLHNSLKKCATNFDLL